MPKIGRKSLDYASSAQHPRSGRFRQAVNLINRLQPRVLEQAESRETKQRVPDIDHVAGPVRDAASLGVLAAQDEPDQLVLVDPVCLADHLQAAQHPPAVADILLLLRPAVEAAPGNLPLAQPPSEPLLVYEVLSPGDGQGSNACEYLPGMGLGVGAHTVSAVKVGTRRNVVDRLADVDEMLEAQEGQRIEGAVEEARVFLPPLVAGERAGLAVLKIGNV